VRADLVALGHHPPHEVGKLHDVAADDEEGGRDILGLERVEDVGGETLVRPVVEGQRNDLSGRVTVAFDGDGAGKAVINFAVDEARCRVQEESPLPRHARLRNPAEGPGSLVADIVGEGHRCQRRSRLCVGPPCDERPCPRIFKPDRPEGDTGDPSVAEGFQLVVQGCCVKEPELPLAAVFGHVRRAGVERSSVQSDGRGVPGKEPHRLGEGETGGLGVVYGPHDGEGAECNAQLLGPDRGPGVIQQGFEPVLRGERAGRCRASGFEECLKQDRIHRLHQPGVTPERAPGLGDKAAFDTGRQRRRHLAQQRAQARDMSWPDVEGIEAEPRIDVRSDLRSQRGNNSPPRLATVE